MWMIVRNSLRSRVRSLGKTLLFFFLILLLTLTMVLGVGVDLYCKRVQEQCDETFQSIINLDYLGIEYPSSDEPDPDARATFQNLDPTALKAIDGVIDWYPDIQAGYALNGYKSFGEEGPYAQYAILELTHFFSVENYGAFGGTNTYSGSAYAIINRVLYSGEDKDNVLVRVIYDPSVFLPEPDTQYLVHGYFEENSISERTFYICGFLWDENVPPAVVSSPEMLSDSIFTHYAERYRMSNNQAAMYYCPRPEYLELFQQSDLWIEEGSFPENDNEVVITSDIAAQLKVHAGDTIELQRAICSEEDRYCLEELQEPIIRTVSGIAYGNSEIKGKIWTIQEEMCSDAPFFGYHLGTLHVENEKGPEAAKHLNQMNPLIRATLLDQGYSRMIRPIAAMRMIARTVIIVCAAAALAVLILFASLFIAREKENWLVLTSLGTPRNLITQWMLSGAAVILAAAVCLGGTGGGLLLQKAVESAMAAAEEMQIAGSAFGEKTIGIVREITVQFDTPVPAVILTSCGIFAAGLGFCILFLRQLRRHETRQSGKSHVHVPGGSTSVKGSGASRFAFLSILRGGNRSLIVPVVSMMMTLMIVVLAGTYQSWCDELETTRTTAILDGQITSLNGQYTSNLVIKAVNARKIWESNLLESISVSDSWHYWLPDEIPPFGNGAFAQERKDAWISSQPVLTALNHLDAGKDFYYTDPEIEWMEGWDEASFCDAEYDPIRVSVVRNAMKEKDSESTASVNREIVLLAGSRFTQAHGLSLGDTFSLFMRDAVDDYIIRVRIVGIFKQHSQRAYLYVPFSCCFRSEWLLGSDNIFEKTPFSQGENWGEMIEKDLIRNTAFDSCRFTVKASELENLRNYLEQTGFSMIRQPGRIRNAVLLRDAAYTELTDELNRFIHLGRIIFGLIFALSAALGFIISWLMMNGRKQEFAIMRGLGVPRSRIFGSFFLEQAFLCTAGTLIGGLAMVIFPAGWMMQGIASAAFLICYFLGCSVSVLMIMRINLMELLSVRE